MAGNIDFHPQEILNRCFVPASNALAINSSAQTGSGNKTTSSPQEIWNRIFDAANNRLSLM